MSPSKRILCGVFCLLASPALGEVITVSDGDDYERLNIVPGRELVMDGGRVGFLNNYGGTSTIKGGVIDSIDNIGQSVGHDNIAAELSIYGSDHGTQPIYINTRSWSETIVHGYNFRVFSFGTLSSGRVSIAGWLLDGSFVEIGIGRRDDARQHRVTVVAEEPTFVDPDGDWDFDLEDLNMIRNNFGLSQARQSDGDTNRDGVVDIADVNMIRNRFGGYDQQRWPVEWEFSGDVPLDTGGVDFPPANPVPEPSTLALTALALCALAGIPLQHRYCWLLRRSL